MILCNINKIRNTAMTLTLFCGALFTLAIIWTAILTYYGQRGQRLRIFLIGSAVTVVAMIVGVGSDTDEISARAAQIEAEDTPAKQAQNNPTAQASRTSTNAADSASSDDNKLPQDRCNTVDCPKNSSVITDPLYGRAYACPNKELALYTWRITKTIADLYQSTGQAPRISPKTGEPIISADEQANTDIERNNAKVNSFDQATARCTLLKAKLRYLVMSTDQATATIKVRASNSAQTVWINNIDLKASQ